MKIFIMHEVKNIYYNIKYKIDQNDNVYYIIL